MKTYHFSPFGTLMCIALLCLAWLMAGCETWLEYNGKIDDPKLCINAEIEAGQPIVVYLTRSWFFTDTTRFYNGNIYGTEKEGFMDNANVELQINHGEWEKLTCVDHAYQSTAIAHAGDTLNIRASAEGFVAVSATEVVPQPFSFELSKASFHDHVADVTLNCNPYTGSPDDVVFIRMAVRGYAACLDTLYRWAKYDMNLVPDSLVITHREGYVTCIFSANPIFAEYDFSQDDYGYYNDVEKLYTSAGQFAKPIAVNLMVDAHYWFNTRQNMTDILIDTIHASEFDYSLFSQPVRPLYSSTIYSEFRPLDAEISIEVMSRCKFLYQASQGNMKQGCYYNLSLYDTGKPSGHWDENGRYVSDSQGRQSSGYTDIDDITDMISTLGIMEEVPIYSNVTNGLGHFSSCTRDTLKITF